MGFRSDAIDSQDGVRIQLDPQNEIAKGIHAGRLQQHLQVLFERWYIEDAELERTGINRFPHLADLSLAGIFFAAVYTTIIPSTGNGLELLAIAGVVIGGTSMSGGTGSLTGTIIGVFTMSILRTGLMSMGLQGQWQTFMTGFVVVGAVLLDQYRLSQANKIKKL